MEVELVESFLVPVRLYDDSWESAREVKCKFANFLLRFLRARADLTEAKSIGGGARARRVVNCIVLFLRPPLQRISLLNMYTVNCIKPLKIINIL